ncbi:MAG: peptidylprolyl isomerase [Candidatus Accumulibacter regalis]|uniref:peptidylprolyl isomerase n=1 Tax=Accumulibacter regalis TaxID=522306 RepID=A0A011QB00_ACCRE|nr:peptidylprolyl isomerase [Accumulibacter sp.]EXI86305.1 MAG: peptidylprolyl isomerase [Candidatus Accumulibacter regalis]HRE71485.1 peptidylprolyl isomerase [Accumulibacter sp.]
MNPISIKRLLREPLLHFMVLGAVLFVGYAYLEPDAEAGSSYEIALTLEELTQLHTIYESQWRRSPTPEEFSAMVENKVRQEVLYREALAMGLDKNDEIVKRRMAQKMQFVAEDLAAAHEPTTEELRAWYAENSDKFAMPKRLSFRHLYFSPDIRGAKAYDDAVRSLAELDGQAVDSQLAETLADRFMYQGYYADQTSVSLAKEFGPQFAVAVEALAPGSWQGPIESGFGWHLVYVDSLVPGRVPAFEEIERDVKTAWLGVQKEVAWRKAYEEMRAKYTLRIPVSVDGAAVADTKAVPVGAEPLAQGKGAPL